MLIDAAKANGSWTVYDEIEDLVIPPDLADAIVEATENYVADVQDGTFPNESESFPLSDKVQKALSEHSEEPAWAV